MLARIDQIVSGTGGYSLRLEHHLSKPLFPSQLQESFSLSLSPLIINDVDIVLRGCIRMNLLTTILQSVDEAVKITFFEPKQVPHKHCDIAFKFNV